MTDQIDTVDPIAQESSLTNTIERTRIRLEDGPASLIPAKRQKDEAEAEQVTDPGLQVSFLFTLSRQPNREELNILNTQLQRVTALFGSVFFSPVEPFMDELSGLQVNVSVGQLIPDPSDEWVEETDDAPESAI